MIRQYGHRIRVRVAGLVFNTPEVPEAVLLVAHTGMYAGRTVWAPPGGALHFGESLTEGVKREVLEETGLEVAVGPLCYTLDFVRPPLHAVSFYFKCEMLGGQLKTGTDPELSSEAQLIQHVRFIPFDQLPGYDVLPEGLADILPEDARADFPGGPQYLGTKW